MTREPSRDVRPTRRGVLATAGTACLAGTLAACGSGGSTVAVATATTGWKKNGTGKSTSGNGATSDSSANALAAASEIPEGSGKIFSDAKVVVTQPSSGEYRAFSAICTHQQCVVDQIANGTIDCPCHGSQFSITDGRVVAGPAPSPLPEKSIKVSGGKIVLA